jgi:hypothetical protein
MGTMKPFPKKLSDKEKTEIHNLRPPFMAKKAIELSEHPEIYDQLPKKIEDFTRLYFAIWKISNKDYQKELWNKHGQWGDNYSETMETFLGTAEGVLDTMDRTIEMTPKQRELLQKFYDMMEDFEENGDAEDPGYGVNDAAIIEDPMFAKCRQYAKLVYEELSGDDLDAWEKQRDMG